MDISWSLVEMKMLQVVSILTFTDLLVYIQKDVDVNESAPVHSILSETELMTLTAETK